MQGTVKKELNPSVRINRAIFNRRVTAAANFVAGFFSMLALLYRINPGRMRATTLIIIGAPALFPYLVSAALSWQVMTPNRVRLALYLLVLLGGTVFGILATTGALGRLSGFALLGVYGAQLVVYVLAGAVLSDGTSSRNGVGKR